MDIRFSPVQPDSSRDSDGPSKKKRTKTKAPHEEEIWSERSDYYEVEDVYTPSEQPEEKAEE